MYTCLLLSFVCYFIGPADDAGTDCTLFLLSTYKKDKVIRVKKNKNVQQTIEESGKIKKVEKIKNRRQASKLMQQQKIHYESVIALVNNWNIPFRIKQKYPVWKLRFSRPKFSSDWHSLIQHALIHYLLIRLPHLFSHPTEPYILTQVQLMQVSYSRLLLKKKTQMFELRMVILVKSATYFIASHHPQVLIDSALEADIFQLTTSTILGTSLEPRAYETLLKNVSEKRHGKRASFDEEDTVVEKIIAYNLERRDAKSRHNLSQKFTRAKVQHSELQSYKKSIKQNLYVKPIPRSKPIQYSITALNTPNSTKKTILERKKAAIHSNQLSISLKNNSSLDLKDVYNFSIRCSPKRLTKVNQIPCQKMKPDSNFQKIPSKKMIDILRQTNQRVQNCPKKWISMVEELKKVTYHQKFLTEGNQIDHLNKTPLKSEGTGKQSQRMSHPLKPYSLNLRQKPLFPQLFPTRPIL